MLPTNKEKSKTMTDLRKIKEYHDGTKDLLKALEAGIINEDIFWAASASWEHQHRNTESYDNFISMAKGIPL